MEAIKLCIVLTVLALMARYASRFLMSGAGTNPGLAQWIDQLSISGLTSNPAVFEISRVLAAAEVQVASLRARVNCAWARASSAR